MLLGYRSVPPGSARHFWKPRILLVSMRLEIPLERTREK